jgi:glutamine amidotransferase
LITRETRRCEGDLRAGITTAVSWVCEHLPVYSLNLILATDAELFALRYPEANTLYVLERGAGGEKGDEPLHHRSSLGTSVRSEEAARRPIVVLASEAMDDDPGWRAVESGELLHIDDELGVDAQVVLPDPPAHPLNLSDLSEPGRISQSAAR